PSAQIGLAGLGLWEKRRLKRSSDSTLAGVYQMHTGNVGQLILLSIRGGQGEAEQGAELGLLQSLRSFRSRLALAVRPTGENNATFGYHLPSPASFVIHWCAGLHVLRDHWP